MLVVIDGVLARRLSPPRETDAVSWQLMASVRLMRTFAYRPSSPANSVLLLLMLNCHKCRRDIRVRAGLVLSSLPKKGVNGSVEAKR